MTKHGIHADLSYDIDQRKKKFNDSLDKAISDLTTIRGQLAALKSKGAGVVEETNLNLQSQKTLFSFLLSNLEKSKSNRSQVITDLITLFKANALPSPSELHTILNLALDILPQRNGMLNFSKPKEPASNFETGCNLLVFALLNLKMEDLTLEETVRFENVAKAVTGDANKFLTILEVRLKDLTAPPEGKLENLTASPSALSDKFNTQQSALRTLLANINEEYSEFKGITPPRG